MNLESGSISAIETGGRWFQTIKSHIAESKAKITLLVPEMFSLPRNHSDSRFSEKCSKSRVVPVAAGLKKRLSPIAVLVVLQGLACSSSYAEDADKFFTLTIENDVFIGEDDGYTNGLGVTFGQRGFTNFGDDNLPKWLQFLTHNLYISTEPDKTRGISHMFFQRMQTPEDLSNSLPIPDDLPYAGLLAWQGTMYSWDNDLADQLSFYLGLVGPSALGEPAQKAVHGLLGSDDPKGWDHQIHNEPVFKVEVQRLWTLVRSESHQYQFDLLGLGGFGLGNLESATKGGFALRWGTNLSESFGAFSLQADRHVNPLAFSPNNNFFMYIGARAGYVANDILVDGNTFKDSPSVPLEHFQNEVAAGAALKRGNWAYTFTLSSASSRTTITDKREKYGAVSFTRRF